MYPQWTCTVQNSTARRILDVAVISVNPAIEVSRRQGVATLPFNTIDSPNQF